MFDRKTDADAEVLDEVYARTGAVVIGKRMFDLGEGVRLFDGLGGEPIELERPRTIETPSATHLRFTVVD
jgi:hypothetical protein